jgi:flagellar biosynthetic protein FliP
MRGDFFRLVASAEAPPPPHPVLRTPFSREGRRGAWPGPASGLRPIALLLVLAAVFAASGARAETSDIAQAFNAVGGAASGRIVQLVALMTVLSLAPGLLMMVTCFTRFVIALSFLRSGLGLQSTPANLVLVSLSLFMTFFVMAPTFDKAWKDGIKPMMENQLPEEQAFPKIIEPFRQFMLAQTREKDIKMFEDLAHGAFEIKDRASVDLRVLIPSFMISELRRGFEMGFLIALPFLMIDMIVATLTMSMGMMMLPPSLISMPMKLLFFVLIDGWNMLIGSLVRSVN